MSAPDSFSPFASRRLFAAGEKLQHQVGIITRINQRTATVDCEGGAGWRAVRHAASCHGHLIAPEPDVNHGVPRTITTLATGLRQANVTRLQWKQISLERRHLWVSGAEHKNGRPHSVPRNQAALDVLEKRKGDHPTHVFTYEGNPIVQVNTRAWRNALQRAGIHDFRWHDLRHYPAFRNMPSQLQRLSVARVS